MAIGSPDYNGPELVPSGLRAFRHYRSNGRELTPTIIATGPIPPGAVEAKCLVARTDRAERGCRKCNGMGVVEMRQDLDWLTDASQMHRIGVAGIIAAGISEQCSCVVECEPPNRKCKCGWYASYSSQVNFFGEYLDQMGWGTVVDIPIVAAVVECSGRVLMGKLGVRAQRMQPVALALDMEHIEAMRRGYSIAERFAYPFNSNGVTGVAMRTFPPLTTHEMAAELEVIAALYGAEFYGSDKRAMYADYPDQDLSGLIKNQEK